MSFRRSIETASTAAAPTFLIVQTGSTLPALRARRGDFPQWFQRGMGLPQARFSVVRADAGQPLPDATAHVGVIVTGSPAMVSERLDWSERTADWLRHAVQARVPLLGVCYGHQLLAHALGGSVDYHPVGREVGTVGIERLPAAAHDALLGAAPARFLAHASHRQSVLELPAGAVALARSAHDPHHAVRYAPNAWGLQFHPEFSVEVVRAYLRHGADGARTECPAACCGRRIGVPAPHARRLLHRFRDLALLSRDESVSCRHDGSQPADHRA